MLCVAALWYPLERQISGPQAMAKQAKVAGKQKYQLEINATNIVEAAPLAPLPFNVPY